jgi:esterase/lipase superfamily enzyme
MCPHLFREADQVIIRQPRGFPTIVTPAHAGAYNPCTDLFQGTLSLSGLYRLDRPEFGLAGHELADVYFNSPLTYLANLSDPWYLEQYAQRTIIVCAGQGAWDEESLADTRHLSAICREKNIGAWIDVWGHDVNHDWPWWYKQMNYFLGHLYP